MCDLHLCQTFNRVRLLCTCQVCRQLPNQFESENRAMPVSIARLRSHCIQFIRKVPREMWLSRCVRVRVCITWTTTNKGEIQMRENKWQNHSSAVTCRPSEKCVFWVKTVERPKPETGSSCCKKNAPVYRKYCSALWWHLCARIQRKFTLDTSSERRKKS